MTPNYLHLLIAAIIPMALGMLWYHRSLFGKAWMKEAGITEESAKQANMAVMLGLTFVVSFVLAFGMYIFVMQEPSMMCSESETMPAFLHGAIHGSLAAVVLGIPALLVNALFEMKSLKYMIINGLYWVVAMAIMGGYISMFA